MNKMNLYLIKRLLKYHFLLFLIFLISSCAKSSKPVEYYMLDASVGIYNNQTLKGDEGPMIGLGPISCLLYTSPSPRDRTRSRMPSSA